MSVLRLTQMQPAHLVEVLTRIASFQKYDGRSKGYVIIDCPAKIASTYLARGTWRLRALSALIMAPTMRPDGTLITLPGYDDSTGAYYDPQDVEFPLVPDEPTREQALAALTALKVPISKYKFVSDTSRSVALSMFLTAVVRAAMPVVPLHALSAPAAGSGKSKMVDAASVVATGEMPAVLSTSEQPEEFEKRLVSSMLCGDPIIAIDNVSTDLGGTFLCQCVERPLVSLRPLGKSDAVKVLNTALLCATGNNLVLAGDMVRRALLAKVDPGVARPELLSYEFDPIKYARDHRAELVVAALTVVRWRVVSGESSGAGSFGSFDEWSYFVRDSLMLLGEADPVGSLEEVRADDPQLESMREILQLWHKHLKGEAINATKLINCDPLRSALLKVAERGGSGFLDATKLGYWLKKHADRRVAVDDKVLRFSKCVSAHKGNAGNRYEILEG